MTQETKTIYLVKYALTQGIVECDLVRRDDYGYVEIFHEGEEYDYMTYNFFRLGKEVTETREEAVEIAEKMRLKRIKSLEKQLDKMKNLRF